jgi:hypothetical protein
MSFWCFHELSYSFHNILPLSLTLNKINKGFRWLKISSFSMKNLGKNVHYFSTFFSLEKQVKNVKLLQHFLACFNFFTLKAKKW